MLRQPKNRIAAAIGAAVAFTTLTALLFTAPVARAETTPVPGVLTNAPRGTTTISVPVADGLRPSSLTGRLVNPGGATGRVTFTVAGRVVADRPATAGPVVLPVTRADVGADKALDVTMTYSERGGRCVPAADQEDVSLRGLRLRYTGTETAPTNPGDFFPASSPRVDVVIPPASDDDVLAAGLAAVAAISSRYDESTAIQLSVAGSSLPTARPGQRLVQISSAPGSSVTSVTTRAGVPTLDLRGSGDDLAAAARALGSDRLALADSRRTTDLSERFEARDVSLTRTFADLDAATVKLTDTQSSQYIGVKQDSFGGPVDSMRIRVTGTHTAVPDGDEVQLNTYLNGYLLDSQLLGKDPALSVDVTAKASSLNTDNGLEFTLTSADGRCDDDLPVEVYFDGIASTVTAERGEGDTRGFDLFPQVLGGQLPVAIRGEGTGRTRSAIDAAYLVSALARAAAAPLDVDLVDADDFLAGDRTGLLVGATAEDADALKAPLRFAEIRLLNYAQATFQVGTNQPFAALEAVPDSGRQVLMLGTWSPDDDTDAAVLSRRAAMTAASRGWSSLTDDLMIASSASKPFTISSNYMVPQPQRAEERRGFIVWFILGIAVLLLLLAWQLLRTSRQNRRVRELVDAQQRSDLERSDQQRTTGNRPFRSDDTGGGSPGDRRTDS